MRCIFKKIKTFIMPAYSFKERFVVYVKEGSKPHTIRLRRKKGAAKVGDQLHLFFGMRTKFCTKLRQEVCTKVNTIFIGKDLQIIIISPRLTDQEFEYVQNCNTLGLNAVLKKRMTLLTHREKDQLAWKDGFRPVGSSLEKPDGSFELMFRFWNQTHSLPFIGDIIHWDPKPDTLPSFNDRTTLETTHY
jgi:hypothetical protein